MRTVIFTVAALSLASTFAWAQQPAPMQPSQSTTPAVKSPSTTTNNPAAPVAGENSFTEAQAKERIAEAGFTDVGTLALDANGVWRGMAMKDGKSVNVGLDYQGNVVQK